ncbi:putative NADP-dependent alcohol dehydrogenase C 2 [Amylocarpus encephaloides]|uniref:NADP-dependent alcohol dehydrogenase C 2 n=1 Tax=Amylocarpus encephaloides TaxID=45428 RepID=A0A9P7YKG2_9HELO|nr:putative NADP-dependent alcohol dehydrogenase C 2 [Amylocarpus encephaloides]
MATVFRGIEGSGKKSPLEVPTELGPKEILMKITHASLCGTDVHFMATGAALGHEGVGIVEKVGSQVTEFKIGDRAGAGYIRNASLLIIGALSVVLMERKTSVLALLGTTHLDLGHETFLHKIPDNLASDIAAPLQCAGATVYSAIVSTAKPGDRVGILGIGGLGHLAIQFSAKLGFETVVFSTSAKKEAEARSFGANEFVLLTEPEKSTQPIDVLIVAGNKYPDWAKFMKKEILARTATIVPLAAPMANFDLPSFPIFFNGYNIKPTLVASRQVHDDMLAFAASHDVKPTIETFEFTEEGFKEAYDKLMSGGMRYRGVLVK